MKIQEQKNTKTGTVIDVRTPAEFMGGSASGALNIPLSEIQNRIDEIRQLNTSIIICCASGNRSGQAEQFLKSKGIECSNGGAWFEVEQP